MIPPSGIARDRKTAIGSDLRRFAEICGCFLSSAFLCCAYAPGSSESIRYLNQAVDFLRQAGTLDMLPRALLARGAPRDLDEVFRIATRSGMRLHLTDYHLVSARLGIKDGNPAKAREHFVEAEKLVNETGYHRRDKDLEQLRAQLGR